MNMADLPLNTFVISREGERCQYVRKDCGGRYVIKHPPKMEMSVSAEGRIWDDCEAPGDVLQVDNRTWTDAVDLDRGFQGQQLVLKNGFTVVLCNLRDNGKHLVVSTAGTSFFISEEQVALQRVDIETKQGET